MFLKLSVTANSATDISQYVSGTPQVTVPDLVMCQPVELAVMGVHALRTLMSH